VSRQRKAALKKGAFVMSLRACMLSCVGQSTGDRQVAQLTLLKLFDAILSLQSQTMGVSFATVY